MNHPLPWQRLLFISFALFVLLASTQSRAEARSPLISGAAALVPLSANSSAPAPFDAQAQTPHRLHTATMLLQRTPWILPLTPVPGIHRPYEAPPTRYTAGHRGVDFVAADHQPLHAPDDGVIHFQGTVVDRPVVSIQHDDGYLSSFEPAQSDLVAGDRVVAGQTFGTLRHDLSESAHCAATPAAAPAAVAARGPFAEPATFSGFGSVGQPSTVGESISGSETPDSSASVAWTGTRMAALALPTPQRAIAPCLHVGARLNGEYVNPMLLFGLLSRPILLPVYGE